MIMEKRELRAKLTNELMKQRQNKISIQAFSEDIISEETKVSVIKAIDLAILQIKEDIRQLDGNRRLE